MKRKIILIVIIYAATAFFTACKKDLLDTNPYNAIGSENMWSTESLADLGVNGVYQALRNSIALKSDVFFRQNYTGLDFYLFDADGFTGYFYDKTELTYGTVTTSSQFFTNYWKQNYEGIHRANDAILNLAEKAPLDTIKKPRLIAECKFLRAWFYYNLNQVFKGVPVYLTPITIDECTRGRETETKVWETIINDLTDCINSNLPDFYPKTEYGRATKAAAYALRGKVYMWMKDYAKAEADLRKVGTLGPQLYTGVYKRLFKIDNEQCPEMIFSVQNISIVDLGSFTQRFLGSRIVFNPAGGWGFYLPSTDFVDSFENADGSPFSWDTYLPGYSSMTPAQRVVFFLRNGLSTADINAFAANGADMTKYLPAGNEERLKPAYANRDPRLAAVVITPYSTFTGSVNSMEVHDYTLRWPYKDYTAVPYDIKSGDYSGIFTYLWRKWVYEGNTELIDRDYGPIDQPLIRYADVVLLLAEAINEQRYPDQEAIDLVNSVRTRAGVIALQNTNASLPTYISGQDNLRERIRNERRWELACEGINLFDEMRWGTWKDKKFYPGNGVKQVWGKVIVPYSWRGDYLYKWPIPQTEIEMNSNLVQNGGWVY
ncbi:MAG: RagB/SusD family nutrient uptake outer membrane protein [Bacteroidia bacterium]|nr:RagB/SusD family nutrient uptake outer membrane protein [Bacteroidia bacterium]